MEKFLYIRFFEHQDLPTPSEKYPIAPVSSLEKPDFNPCDKGVNSEILKWLTAHPLGKVDFVVT